jgi:large subunit ribosomal protein L18e
MSRKNQSSISLSKVVKYALKNKNKIIVIVGKVLNDERLSTIPKLNLCSLRISDSARTRILEGGGKIFTFDALAIEFPTGKNLVLLRGKKYIRIKSFKNKKTA